MIGTTGIRNKLWIRRSLANLWAILLQGFWRRSRTWGSNEDDRGFERWWSLSSSLSRWWWSWWRPRPDVMATVVVVVDSQQNPSSHPNLQTPAVEQCCKSEINFAKMLFFLIFYVFRQNQSFKEREIFFLIFHFCIFAFEHQPSPVGQFLPCPMWFWHAPIIILIIIIIIIIIISTVRCSQSRP